MGNKQGNSTNLSKEGELLLQKNQFEFMYIIGRGGFGKVWKVLSKKNKKLFAMKEMSKAKIIDKRSEKSVRAERELLSKIKHPFIVNMYYAFQEIEYLYIVMDLLTGGDLRYHIAKQKRFTEEQTKFFVACIVLSLEYIHTNSILHRDIKPENLVFDNKGYIRITDFGIAKLYRKDNSTETSGTPGYMAPEVMCAQNHTCVVDYFALGVFTYEFMNGKRPYHGKSRKEIKENIMSKQVQIKKHEVPEGWSAEAADFVNRLLQRKPANRLGLRGATEVKEHPWLKYFPWKDLYGKNLEAPFIPKIGDNFDKRYCSAIDNIGNETMERYEKYIKDQNCQSFFKDFNFIYLDEFEENSEEAKKNSKFNNPHSELENGLIEKKSVDLSGKILKLHKLSPSSNNKFILKHYRNSSNFSTGTSQNNSKRSGSSIG